jgi:hypothetical protein
VTANTITFEDVARAVWQTFSCVSEVLPASVIRAVAGTFNGVSFMRNFVKTGELFRKALGGGGCPVRTARTYFKGLCVNMALQ